MNFYQVCSNYGPVAKNDHPRCHLGSGQLPTDLSQGHLALLLDCAVLICSKIDIKAFFFQRKVLLVFCGNYLAKRYIHCVIMYKMDLMIAWVWSNI